MSEVDDGVVWVLGHAGCGGEVRGHFGNELASGGILVFKPAGVTLNSKKEEVLGRVGKGALKRTHDSG